MRLKGAFSGCSFCGGNGCMCCDAERKKAEEQAAVPIFTADRNNPQDMELLKRYFGADAVKHAFGPDGHGMDEIHANAAIASLLQAMRAGGNHES